MKLALAVLCIVGFASCNGSTSSSQRDLGTILEEFAACLDKSALEAWILEKMTTDPDFGKLVAYLQGDHYKIIDAHIIADKWFNNFLVYLESKGVKVYEQLNALREILGLPPLKPPFFHVTAAATSSLAPPEIEWELLHLLVELWQITKGSLICQIEVGYKYVKDPAIDDLFKQFEDPTFVAFLKYVWEKQEVKELFELIQKGGIDLEHAVTAIKRLLSLVCDNQTPFDKYRPVPLRLAQEYAKYMH